MLCYEKINNEFSTVTEEENRSLWWLNDFKDKDIEAVNVEALFCPKKGELQGRSIVSN